MVNLSAPVPPPTVNRSFLLVPLTNQNDGAIAGTIFAIGRSPHVLWPKTSKRQPSATSGSSTAATLGYLFARPLPADAATSVVCKP